MKYVIGFVAGVVTALVGSYVFNEVFPVEDEEVVITIGIPDEEVCHDCS